MADPFQQQLPTGQIARIKRLARDFAYGALNGLWEPEFWAPWERDTETYSFEGRLGGYIAQTWKGTFPDLRMLEILGYLYRLGESKWSVTAKSLALLEEQLQSVFISYHRPSSSGLALFIWSELQREGYPCFIDVRDIRAGETWHSYLEKAVRETAIFIPVLAEASLG